MTAGQVQTVQLDLADETLHNMGLQDWGVRKLDVGGKAQLLKSADDHPGHVELALLQAVLR